MKLPKVRTFRTNSGGVVANQFSIITPKDKHIFQSYGTTIAVKNMNTGKITLDEACWDYSATTGKYRNKFLGEGIADTREKIKSGEYALKDLNK